MSLTRRNWFLHRALPAAAVLGAPLAGSRSAFAAPSAVPPVRLDPSLRVHPALQMGAQRSPDRKVRVLVQKTTRAASSHAIAQAANTRVLEEFGFVKTLVLEVPLRVVPQLARNPNVRYISPDGTARIRGVSSKNLKTTYPFTAQAPDVWNNKTLPSTGKKIGVAVLDTGVNAKHPDLGGKIASVVNNSAAATPDDLHGHGTHIAGIITGLSAIKLDYVGIAPDAHLLSVKIADDTGIARASDLIRGLQWVFDNRATYGIRVVNLSVTAAFPESYRTSPVCAAVEQLWFNGVVVVVAAGNGGSATGSVWCAPANDPYVITVGAVDEAGSAVLSDDVLPSWSSRGTTQDGYYKPDVVAPGRRIVAPLSSSTSVLAALYPDRIVDGAYIRLSGTSMAAPVVAGAVALLLERFPSLTPDRVKGLLLQTRKAYRNMPDKAGVVSALDLLNEAQKGTVVTANAGLTPSMHVDGTSGTVLWDQAYWDQAYWDQAYWDQAYWDQAYWDQAYWDQASGID